MFIRSNPAWNNVARIYFIKWHTDYFNNILLPLPLYFQRIKTGNQYAYLILFDKIRCYSFGINGKKEKKDVLIDKVFLNLFETFKHE